MANQTLLAAYYNEMSTIIDEASRSSACDKADIQVIPDSKVHGANMGPSEADRTQVGPMLAPWILLSGMVISACGQGIIQCYCYEKMNL